jgi:Tol biopolymer transport system component
MRPYLSITSDGKWLLYSGRESVDQKLSAVYAVSPETGAARKLNLDPSRYWVAPVLSPDRRQLAIARLQTDGTTEVLVSNVDGTLGIEGEPRLLKTAHGWSVPVAWTADSREVLSRYAVSAGAGGRLMRIPADGSGLPRAVLAVGDGITAASVSARGDRLVYSHWFGPVHIWGVTLTGPGKATAPEPVMQSGRAEWVRPNAWAPDSHRLAIESDRSGVTTVWVANADGSQASMLVTGGEYMTGSPAWSPDGRWIAFDSRGEGHPEIYVVSADGGVARRLTNHLSYHGVPAWSRDGKWVYFNSDRTGRFEVFKVAAEGGEAVQITRNGGFGAQESPDGKWLYYTRDRGPVPTIVGVAPRFPLLRLPTGASEEEEQVLDGVTQRSWALAAGGVWYLWREKNQNAELRFFDFKTRRSATAVTMNKPMPPGLALSPDGRTLLFNQLDQQNYEILLVENFR